MNLTEKEFKEYYDKYYRDMPIDEEALDDLLRQWIGYRDKIIDGTLTGLEYNSTLNHFGPGSVSSFDNSLEYFMENGSGAFGGFGSIVSGKLVLWIEDDSKNNGVIWHKKVKDSSGKLVDTILKTSAEQEEFRIELVDYLKSLITKTSFDDLISFLENKNNFTDSFGSPSFLERMVIMNSWVEKEGDAVSDYDKKLIFIYDFSNILKMDLFKDFACEDINLRKNKKILKKTLDLLDLQSPTIYDLTRIQKFLWGLTDDADSSLILSKDNKNIIFYGAPGTGKTWTVKKALESRSNIEYEIVQFHPAFTYEDFIEGIKPVGIDSSGNLKFEIVNGCFKEFCIRAKDNPDKEFYFVADEINRANLSAVFGEVLSLLEDGYRFDPANPNKANTCLTPLSKIIQKLLVEAYKTSNQAEIDKLEKLAFYKIQRNGNDFDVVFGIPKNVHFVGMMNDVDRSIDTFDLALRRRFVWIRKDFDPNVINAFLKTKRVKEEKRKEYLMRCIRLNTFITGHVYDKEVDLEDYEPLNLGKSYEFGHSFFMRLPDESFSVRKILNESIQLLWKKHLEPTLREYLRNALEEHEIDSQLKRAKDIFCS